MRERLRWMIASQLNRLPGQCWADLVTWALGWTPRWPVSQPVSGGCRVDMERNGCCYCGKLQRADSQQEVPPVTADST